MSSKNIFDMFYKLHIKQNDPFCKINLESFWNFVLLASFKAVFFSQAPSLAKGCTYTEYKVIMAFHKKWLRHKPFFKTGPYLCSVHILNLSDESWYLLKKVRIGSLLLTCKSFSEAEDRTTEEKGLLIDDAVKILLMCKLVWKTSCLR